MLRNNLLAAIGFIELANAADFPANVWNEAPLPLHAVILMALGGILAFCVLPFVIGDAVLSYRNVLCLREERKYLEKRKQSLDGPNDGAELDFIDCLLQVNFREQGTEWVDRVGMDAILGVGAFIVGIGTFMAIGGENPHIHTASDLLTGYIGNSPCALYGLVNLAWSAFIWIRANRQTRGSHVIENANRDASIQGLLELRAKEFKLHGFISGAMGLFAAAASLLTYTHWQAYIALAVCLAMSVWLNRFWRLKLGYDRPLLQRDREVVFYGEDITDALKYTMHWSAMVEAEMKRPSNRDLLGVLQPTIGSPPEMITFLRRHHLFEEFCLELCSQVSHEARLFGIQDGGSRKIQADHLLDLASEDEAIKNMIEKLAKEVIREAAPTCFHYQQRWLLEALGCCLTMSNGDTDNLTRSVSRKHESSLAHDARPASLSSGLEHGPRPGSSSSSPSPAPLSSSLSHSTCPGFPCSSLAHDNDPRTPSTSLAHDSRPVSPFSCLPARGG
ncbi:hypothetical protein QBC34DRAFT_361437 [Podospora aff. communis PSN243]|uniref:Integral membrane protein n=1 Tax=Podospora aff. communis PSN243 TaxID=3040156 RepID=A0AAV9G6L1_9PEZI|nr:hypothetical protein QBC34DRAFT_361437 [Podospora aff. communis PSN243]